MRDLVAAFLEASLAEVHRYGGTAPQFTGDGFMALFGAPLTYEDHVRRALLAAVAIRRALGGADCSRERATEPAGADRHPHRTRRLWPDRRQLADGCHGDRRHGECRRPTAASGRAGNDPAERGDPPAGARFCAARAGRAAHPEGQGRADRGLSAARCFPPALRARESGSAHTTTFVDRDSELAILNNFLRQVENGRSQAIGVVGEPGIGKSRLLAEFRQQLARGRVTWVEGRCVSYGTAIPYWLLLDLLRSNCGIVETDAPEAIIEKIRSGLQEVGMDPEQDSPVLLHLLGVKDVGDSPALSNPEAVKAKAFEIFRQLSVKGSRRRPLVSGAR